MKNKSSKKILLLLISYVILIADQISKYYAVNYLKEGVQSIFIKDFIGFRLVRNTGAAFSILNNHTNFLTIISLLVSLSLTILIVKESNTINSQNLGFSFLLGGSIGNGIDRFYNGYVIDFLEILPFKFPIFNLADISINIALILFLIHYIKYRKLNSD